MLEESKMHKLVLIYDDSKDDFRPAPDSALLSDNITFIIDEKEKKSKLILPNDLSVILKKTIERRVLSYLKTGYPIDSQSGLRIGANFRFEVFGSDQFFQEEANKSIEDRVTKRYESGVELKEAINYKKKFEAGKSYEDYVSSMGDADRKSKYNSYFNRYKLSQDQIKYLQKNVEHEIKILAIGASWCFDCQTNLSLLAHIVYSSPKLELRILHKENAEELLNYVNKGHRIPQLFFLSPDYYHVENWTERSTEQFQLYGSLRKILGWDNPDFVKEYRKAFARDFRYYAEKTTDELIDKIKRTDALLSTSKRMYPQMKKII